MGTKWSGAGFNDAAALAGDEDLVGLQDGANVRIPLATVLTLLDDRYAGAGPPVAGSVAGAYYLDDVVAEGSGVSTLSFSTLYAVPILLAPGTLVEIAARHFGTATGGEVFRVGLFADNGRVYPGARVLDAGTIDLSTAPDVKGITISHEITTPGLYWLVGAKQGGSNASTMLVHTVPAAFAPTRISLPAAADFLTRIMGYSQASVTGALPSNFTSTVTAVASNMPVLGVKYS